MARTRSNIRKIAGQLTLEIQKVWGEKMGEPESTDIESTMHKSHDLLVESLEDLELALCGDSVRDFIGAQFYSKHPRVAHLCDELERLRSHD